MQSIVGTSQRKSYCVAEIACGYVTKMVQKRRETFSSKAYSKKKKKDNKEGF